MKRLREMCSDGGGASVAERKPTLGTTTELWQSEINPSMNINRNIQPEVP